MIFKNKDRIQQTYSLDGNGIEAFSSWMELVLQAYDLRVLDIKRLRKKDEGI